MAAFVRQLTPQHPDPFDQDDVSLAEELAGRVAVCVDNARRYTRERTTALTLQRSLLPRAMTAQVAVEFASRYLPARSEAGVGGDWFDVIPLSGTRVGLVVGDVVGHGIHASVTMGRPREAVRHRAADRLGTRRGVVRHGTRRERTGHHAIRYGGAPIQLRLIRDRSLICEVSDASSTSPHMRRARTYDEGGRGLLLVAQLTDRWGSRPCGSGRTIWAERALPVEEASFEGLLT